MHHKRVRRLVVIGFGLALPALGCASNSSEPANDDPIGEPSDGGALYEELAAGANYIPLSLSQTVANSEVIALGKMVNVERGMTEVNENSQSGAKLYTIVIRFEPSSVLKGNDSTIYLEFAVGPPPDLDTLNASLPDQELAIFGTPATRTPVEGVTYENEGAGYPAGAALHRLTTPQGLLEEGEDALVQPLETRGEQLFDESATTFEDLTAQIEAML
jgi:hypothetical protein